MKKNNKIRFLSIFLWFSIISCEQNGDSARQILISIYDNLSSAICNCSLGDALKLESVFSCCDMLRTMHHNKKFDINDHDIVCDIVQLINTRLMHNPALILFFNNLNMSVEYRQQLSNYEFDTILKNSALLVPINELFWFAEIINVIHGNNRSILSLQRLKKILKSVELNVMSTPLQLWERKQSLKRAHELREYQAVTLAEKIKCVKQFDRICRDMNIIFDVIGITDEYVVALKRLEPCGGYSQSKLYDLFENAFCGETETLTLQAYARYIEKCVRQNEKIF